MNADSFFDTNLLIYFATDPIRRQRIQSLVRQCRTAFTSTQVFNEFANVCLKKKLLTHTDIETALTLFANFLTVVPLTERDTHLALKLQARYGYSFYDSLILASALSIDCHSLYTEDMQHSQKIASLTIRNPFI